MKQGVGRSSSITKNTSNKLFDNFAYFFIKAWFSLAITGYVTRKGCIMVFEVQKSRFGKNLHNQ